MVMRVPALLWAPCLLVGLAGTWELAGRPPDYEVDVRAPASYADEWVFNHAGKDKPPACCVAISGGGIRSAAFGMGVLHGLHEKGLLERVDAVSAVSGGTYTLSWLLLQPYYANLKDGLAPAETFTRMFEEKGDFQKRLEAQASLLEEVTTPVAAVWTPTIDQLFRAFFFMAPDPKQVNHGSLRQGYREAIQWTFHGLPATGRHDRLAVRNRAKYTPTDYAVFANWSVVDPVAFPDLARFARRHALPSFIFNTTLRVDRSHRGLLWATVFELTPLRMGVESYGYADWNALSGPEFRGVRTVNLAPGISGAALSGALQPTGGAARGAVRGLNLDLGYFIPTMTKKKPPFIYLSDGGHSENLGLYSLVRRRCRSIIVIDGEHEPEAAPSDRFSFASYRDLKTRVCQEDGIDVTVPAIDEQTFSSSRPVLKGTIEYGPEGESADLLYVKLALGRPWPGDLPSEVRTHAERDRVFPHDPTTNQRFSPEQFRAYRKLGHWMVVRHAEAFASVGRPSERR